MLLSSLFLVLLLLWPPLVWCASAARLAGDDEGSGADALVFADTAAAAAAAVAASRPMTWRCTNASRSRRWLCAAVDRSDPPSIFSYVCPPFFSLSLSRRWGVHKPRLVHEHTNTQPHEHTYNKFATVLDTAIAQRHSQLTS